MISLRVTPTAIFFGASLLSVLGSSLTNIALAYQFLLSAEGVDQYAILIYATTVTGILLSGVIGAQIDLFSRYEVPMFVINIFNAVFTGILATTPTFPVVVIIVVVTTALSIANFIAIRKLLPIIFASQKLREATAIMTEIAAIGAVFGPLMAPLFLLIKLPLSTLYAIDAASFLVTAFAYYWFLTYEKVYVEAVKEPTQTRRTLGDIFLSLSRIIIAVPKMYSFFITYVPYIFAFSGLFFTLAIYNKTMANGDELMFAMPIVAMFLGRMVASNILKRNIFKIGYDKMFGIASLMCMFIMTTIGICSSMFLFIVLEFFLGMGVSALLFAQTMWLQTECPIEYLGTANGILRTIESVTKLLGVPIVTFVANSSDSWVAAMCISLAFGISAASMRVVGKHTTAESAIMKD